MLQDKNEINFYTFSYEKVRPSRQVWLRHNIFTVTTRVQISPGS